MIEKALISETAALSFDKRINNSEGASFSTSNNLFVQANSMDLLEASHLLVTQ